MKNQNLTKEQTDALIEMLEQVPVEQVMMGQCASLCSCFISGSYITANSKELVNELVFRHKGMLEKKSVESVIQSVLNFGVDVGVFNEEANSKYSPTEMGWFLGRDWQMKMKFNDFNVGV